MNMKWMAAVVLGAFCSTSATMAQEGPHAPVSLGAGASFTAVTGPDGQVRDYRAAMDGESRRLQYRAWRPEERAWSDEWVFEGPPLPEGASGRPQVLFDDQSNCHLFYMKGRPGGGRKPAVDRFIDIWHLRTLPDGEAWSEPAAIYEGYTGSFQDTVQLDNGTIVVPFGAWRGGVPTAPPLGANEATVVYSQDRGQTWDLSPSRLTSPCYPNYNGANYGAVEPVIISLKDGRSWMLIRTQAGYLFESYSVDGVIWSDARATMFVSSDSPAALVRLADDRLMVVWNHSDKPPRLDGQGVYAGRDVIHLAISSDEGRTWKGFRELYRDPVRNESPQATGDRGTAYPSAVATPDGQAIVTTGQGHTGRGHWLVDPDWVEATTHEEDFADADSLDEWSVFSEFGPARRWWRDRRQGARLVPHPDRQVGFALHLRHPADVEPMPQAPAEGDVESPIANADTLLDMPPDGAVWNFPAGQAGTLKLRVRMQDGAGPAEIGLSDRFSNPTDPTALQRSLFRLPLHVSGRIGAAAKPVLETERWHEIALRWDLARRMCAVEVDGEHVTVLPLLRNTPIGACYLRLNNADEQPNQAGLLVDRIEVEMIHAGSLPTHGP